jgi:hypothetical protein
VRAERRGDLAAREVRTKAAGDFVSAVDEAQNSESERNLSRKRNERLRAEGPKSLTSLCAPNQHFAVLFVFKGLTSFSFRAFAACGPREARLNMPNGLGIGSRLWRIRPL